MSIPAARASISARSRMLTINWSRRRGVSSRSPTNAITNTISPTAPHTWNWYRQSGWVGSVRLDTCVTTRLPRTGPIVQNAIATARPTWGEKSRTSAGVATRTAPSTMLTSAKAAVYCALLDALGIAKAISRPLSSRPPTTRFARPQRSASPAPREANAPTAFPITMANTNWRNVKPRSPMICVATAPWMYSS